MYCVCIILIIIKAYDYMILLREKTKLNLKINNNNNNTFLYFIASILYELYSKLDFLKKIYYIFTNTTDGYNNIVKKQQCLPS